MKFYFVVGVVTLLGASLAAIPVFSEQQSTEVSKAEAPKAVPEKAAPEKSEPQKAEQKPAIAQPAAGKNAGPKIPVEISLVSRQDVPVWQRGVGVVKPIQQVQIKPQVDGILQKIWVQEGELVKQGQLLAELDDRAAQAMLAQAEAQLKVTQSKLQVAERDLTRFVGLRQSEAISAQQKEQQQALVNQLNAEVQQAKAAIAAAQVQLSFTKIQSPVAGMVGIRNIDVGNYVRPTDSLGLFSVIQQQPIQVEMALPQAVVSQLQLLKVQNTGPIAAEVYRAEDNFLLAQGLLRVIDNQILSGTGTIRVKAEFANEQQQLWPGQTITMAIQTNLYANVLTIPVKALQQGPQGSFVWRVQAGVAKPAPVKVIFSNNNFVVIEGVAEGEQVVTNGQSRLRPGISVDVKAQTEQTTSAAIQQNLIQNVAFANKSTSAVVQRAAV